MDNIIVFHNIKNNPLKVPGLLRLYRVRSGLTQKELANRLTLQSDRMIKKWETGHSLPEPARMKRLIEVYLRSGVFTVGQELEETQNLWEANKATFELQSFFLNCLLFLILPGLKVFCQNCLQHLILILLLRVRKSTGTLNFERHNSLESGFGLGYVRLNPDEQLMLHHLSLLSGPGPLAWKRSRSFTITRRPVIIPLKLTPKPICLI